MYFHSSQTLIHGLGELEISENGGRLLEEIFVTYF